MPPCLIWELWESAKRDVEVYVMYIVFIEHLLRARHCSICMRLSFLQERGVVDFNIMELRSRKLNKDTPEMGTLTCPSQTAAGSPVFQSSFFDFGVRKFHVRNAMGGCGRSGGCRTTAEMGAERVLISDSRLGPHGCWW